MPLQISNAESSIFIRAVYATSGLGPSRSIRPSPVEVAAAVVLCVSVLWISNVGCIGRM